MLAIVATIAKAQNRGNKQSQPSPILLYISLISHPYYSTIMLDLFDLSGEKIALVLCAGIFLFAISDSLVGDTISALLHKRSTKKDLPVEDWDVHPLARIQHRMMGAIAHATSPSQRYAAEQAFF